MGDSLVTLFNYLFHLFLSPSYKRCYLIKLSMRTSTRILYDQPSFIVTLKSCPAVNVSFDFIIICWVED